MCFRKMITHLDFAFLLNFSLRFLQSQTSLSPFQYRSFNLEDLLILCKELHFRYICNGLILLRETVVR
jgi:hypothetical protein